MTISPMMSGISNKALWDMDRCRFDKRWPYQIQTGANIIDEATFLARATSADGVEVVFPALGVLATEHFAGVALHSGIQAHQWADVKLTTVPLVPNAAGDYVVDIGHTALDLNPAGLLAAVQVWATGVALPWTILGGPFVSPMVPGAGNVAVDAANGLFYFDPANAGAEVTITYRWTLSSVEHDIMIRDNSPNRGVEALFSQITVGCGHCILYTLMYDTRAIWVVDSIAAGDLPVLFPGGLVTTVTQSGIDGFAGAPLGLGGGRVIHRPSTEDPYLGLEFTTF
jgi:hypothetical protein